MRLATSLLKDSNGTIKLDIPVTGTLDDPKFRLWPIIWQIVKNIVVKIVSAPFKLLAGLFQGAEDAQYVDFAPGSPALPDKAKGALPKLADSLAERPELRLDIPAGPISATDKAALDDQRFQAAIAEFRSGQRNAETPYAELDDKDKADVLADMYKRDFGKRPDVPNAAEMQAADVPPSSSVPVQVEIVLDNPNPTRRERKAQRRASEVAWLESQLRPRYRADATAADQLAKARAAAVQDALLANGKVDPVRVFLDATKSTQEEKGKMRMELALE